jgi:trk system potassium uptake protein TrkA
MRAVFIGTNAVTIMTVRELLGQGHEVVIIEEDKGRIDSLAAELDCGFLHGNGSKPAMLREADPESATILYCLTDSDEANILASLVGRSLGFRRVVTKIDDMEFEHICVELGLQDTINPARTIAHHLADVLKGQDPFELSSMLRGDARVASFVASHADAGPLDSLKLPGRTRVACLYRQDQFLLPDEIESIQSGDEVVVITHADGLPEITSR